MGTIKFIGAEWFHWLQKQKIPFHQRVKRNTLVSGSWNQMTRLDYICYTMKRGECCLLPGRRLIWGCLVYVSVLRLEDEEGSFLMIVSSDAPQADAIDAYADRWQIETLFGCLKTKSFNFEDTHLRDAVRLSKMMGLLVLAFAWAYRAGEVLHDGKSPIPVKKTILRPLKSIFRHGLDFLRNIILNLQDKFDGFMNALKLLSCT